MSAGEILIPARVQPFVDVLGIDGAFDFFMEFGGAETFFARKPGADSEIVKAIGREKAAALAARLNVATSAQRIPLAKPFLARVLKSRNVPVAEIARQLHVTNVTVRSMLTEERQRREWEKPAPENLQLSLDLDT